MSEHRSGVPLDFRLPEDYVPPEERRRIARICKKCDPPTRVFGKPDWVCPDHGTSEVQENRPYFGLSTEDGPVDRAAARAALDKELADADLPPLKPASDLLEGGDAQT